VECEVIAADLRDLSLGVRFSLVLMPYNLFNHLLDLDDQRRALAVAARHLGPEGRLVVDTFNPDPGRLRVDGGPAEVVAEYEESGTARRLRVVEEGRYEPATQVSHLVRRTEEPSGAVVATDELRLRVVFPRELDALLTLSGWEVEEKLGGHDGHSFGSRSPHQIAICRRREG
jgi:SAM-dependent methyltransferase